MNYRHDFHAGNFADVFKHIILTRILLHLVKKETAFRYIDTHAGSGFYDFFGTEAEKTGEWRAGIGKLIEAETFPDLDPAARDLIDPYLRLAAPAAEGTVNPRYLYPGSPAIASALLRPQDRMICCELHPAAVQELRAYFGRDQRAKIIEIDGFTGLNAFVPPVERRGLALIDPAFEARDDLERSLGVLESAWRKWSTGIFILWYPIKDQREVELSLQRLARGKIKRILRLELQIADPTPVGPLAANGLLIVNPPFPLLSEAEIILPCLARILGEGASARHHIEWLVAE
jgi:23S rRNA (adenine2030-N6)-methyltransferase